MDSIGTIVACTRAVIDELASATCSDETIRGTIGLGLRETIDDPLPRLRRGRLQPHPGVLPEALGRHLPRPCRCSSRGWRRCLRELAEEGYLLAVATGKSRRGLELRA